MVGCKIDAGRDGQAAPAEQPRDAITSADRGYGLIRQAVCLALLALPIAATAQTTPAPADSLEQRLDRLEKRQQQLEDELRQKDAEIQSLKAQQGAPVPGAAPSAVAAQGGSTAPAAAAAGAAAPAVAAAAPAAAPAAPGGTAPVQTGGNVQAKKWGDYTDFTGFRVANTDKGDMSIALYTYARYLNQKGLDNTYTDAFGNPPKNVQQRQEVQLQKVQIKFLGWILDPKFRYFLYAWSSNATQGQPAQVVLAGNLTYNFNENFALAGGITSLPGVRSTEGNFPFWLNVDNRMMADEFFRPSYTSGFWVRGGITSTLRYMAMIGNNLSTLGVSSAQLDNHFNTLATALIWEPSTGGGGYGIGFGDFEGHQQVATRVGLHYTRSTEDRQSQPNTESIENTQIRLSDGTGIFTPNIFGPGVAVQEVRYQMSSLDGGIKYKGLALEGEVYYRKLDSFEGVSTAGLRSLYDRGFQVQASAMLIPRTFQVYLAGSYIDGEYGDPWDIRAGVNWHPWQNRVFRVNSQVMYLDRSPVGYTSLTYNVGSKGVVFNTDFELAL
ncbi:MAG TPA: hypothetical protein VGI91_04880 [Steroidobacteraceae bacterium]|jgi:hypothetical protein